MSQEAFPQPGADTYNAVVSAIGELQQSGQQHITICWPTTTTALFMRRRLMVDLNGTFAIRNTTSRELLSLIKDATVHLRIIAELNLLPNGKSLPRLLDSYFLVDRHGEKFS